MVAGTKFTKAGDPFFSPPLYRNAANVADSERPSSEEEEGAAPSAPLLTDSPERPRSPPPSYEDVVEEDRKKTEGPRLK